MNRNPFEPGWAARHMQRRRPKTAVERIDEFLERGRNDPEAIRRACRRIFGPPLAAGQLAENDPAQSG